MPRGKRLSEDEKNQIENMRSLNVSLSQMSINLHRSRGVIRKFIRNPQEYGKVRIKGRSRKLTAIQEKQVLKEASKNLSANEIIKKLSLDVSNVTIGRTLKRMKPAKIRVVIRRFIRKPQGYRKTLIKGRARKLTAVQEKQVFKEASKNMSANEIIKKLSLNVSRVTIGRTLKRIKHAKAEQRLRAMKRLGRKNDDKRGIKLFWKLPNRSVQISRGTQTA